MPLRLLGLGLPLTIAAGAAVGVAVLPGVSLIEALVLAVMLACTDAALGQTVVTDGRVPSRIRQGLNVESGLNDGLCVPLFLIAIAVAEADEGPYPGAAPCRLCWRRSDTGSSAESSQVLGGLALRRATRHRSIEPYWAQILATASALLAAGIALALGGSICIAAFTAGFVFGALCRDQGKEVTYLVDEAGELFNAVTFIVFGAVILGSALNELTWRLMLYAVLSLTVVRMLPVAVAMIGTGARPPTLAFLGWFGPRGLASIVFGVILLNDADLPQERTLLLAVVVTVGISSSRTVSPHGR